MSRGRNDPSEVLRLGIHGEKGLERREMDTEPVMEGKIAFTLETKLCTSPWRAEYSRLRL